MTEKLNKAKQALISSGCGLAVLKGEDILTFNEPGVKTLMKLQDGALKGAYIADKIIGKAAAYLLVRSGTVQVYAEIISEPALNVFEQYSMICDYGEVVPNIINRSQTGICPMEFAVLNAQNADEAYEILLRKTGGAL